MNKQEDWNEIFKQQLNELRQLMGLKPLPEPKGKSKVMFDLLYQAGFQWAIGNIEEANKLTNKANKISKNLEKSNKSNMLLKGIP